MTYELFKPRVLLALATAGGWLFSEKVRELGGAKFATIDFHLHVQQLREESLVERKHTRHVTAIEAMATGQPRSESTPYLELTSKGWQAARGLRAADREQGGESPLSDEEFALADVVGWDIQHYKKHRLERAHIVALIAHVHRGASASSGYTNAQADAVLQRLFRSAPTILQAVDEFLTVDDLPEVEPESEDTTATRRRSAVAGIRAVRAKYGDEHRTVPWPE